MSTEAIDIDDFVETQLEAGIFSSYNELVAAALQALRERVREDTAIAEVLRPAMERAKNGHPGITVTLEDVKRLSLKYLASQNDA